MRRMIASAVSFFLMLASSTLEIQAIEKRPLTDPSCSSCKALKLSNAVVNGALINVRNLHAKLKTGEARAGDVQAAVVSLRILFAHFDETGTTQAIEQSILSREEDIIRYTPTRADAERLQKHHAAFGLHTTVDEQLQRMESFTVNDRMRAVELIKNGGMHAYYASVLANYESLGNRLAKAEKTGASPLYRKVWKVKCDYDWVGAAFGIGCAFGCAGCCIVAAFALFFEGAECGG
jgi:hypothetical protein